MSKGTNQRRKSSQRNKPRFWQYSRHRLLPLVLLAFCLQATLPFFLTNCPVYAAAHGLAKTHSLSSSIAPASAAKVLADAGMPADCPMHSVPQDSIPADPRHKSVPCSLCDAMSPFHGYVAAGLIDLPPPIAEQQVKFFPVVASVAPVIRAASFGARAPPVTV